MNIISENHGDSRFKKRRVAIVGTNGLPAKYGGFETLTNYLTLYHSDRFDLFVFCPRTSSRGKKEVINGARMIYLPFRANGIQSIVYDIISIVIASLKFDTLVILGTPGCTILPFIRSWRKPRIIVNFGGLEWMRSKWPALVRWYLRLTEAVAVANSDVLVVDNQAFVDYVQGAYGRRSVLIEYGADHAQGVRPDTALIAEYPFLTDQYFVSVSRAQPDNNLDMVCEAFVGLSEKLVLISNWGISTYGEDVRKRYSGQPNIILLEAVYDLRKINAIRGSAKCYIHSHSFCGTAPSLVEAMMLGLPVISLNVETNIYTTEGAAEYFSSPSELREKICGLSEERANELGKQMKMIAERRYTWKRIVDSYEKLY